MKVRVKMKLMAKMKIEEEMKVGTNMKKVLLKMKDVVRLHGQKKVKVTVKETGKQVKLQGNTKVNTNEVESEREGGIKIEGEGGGGSGHGRKGEVEDRHASESRRLAILRNYKQLTLNAAREQNNSTQSRPFRTPSWAGIQ